jgi:hypothetical protein
MVRVILSLAFVPRVKHVLFASRNAFPQVAASRLTRHVGARSDRVVVNAALLHVY